MVAVDVTLLANVCDCDFVSMVWFVCSGIAGISSSLSSLSSDELLANISLRNIQQKSINRIGITLIESLPLQIQLQHVHLIRVSVHYSCYLFVRLQYLRRIVPLPKKILPSMSPPKNLFRIENIQSIFGPRKMSTTKNQNVEKEREKYFTEKPFD